MNPVLYLVQTKLFAVTACCAVLVGLSGCGPQNLHECHMEAAKMPTERGAGIANVACFEKFPREPAP
jgi:hypothetical protein